jgi:hypothetical protein
MDYKATLNLPKTGFPMKASLALMEPEMLHRWEAIDIYAQLRQASWRDALPRLALAGARTVGLFPATGPTGPSEIAGCIL